MINAHKLGLTLALFSGLLHVLWSILVWLSWAEPLADWVSSIHFVYNMTLIEPFNLGQAVVLVIVAMVVWYVVGNVFGLIWNKVHAN